MGDVRPDSRLGKPFLDRIPDRAHAREVVPVISVGLESAFIEKPLDSTVETGLVRVPILSDGPAHPLVPAEADQPLRRQAHAHQQQDNSEN